MKVVFITTYSSKYPNRLEMLAGFKALGAEVFDLQAKYISLSREYLAGVLDSFQPDWILTVRGQGLNSEIYQAAEERGVATVLWIEHIEDEIEDWVVDLAKANRYFFTSVKGMVERYQQAGLDNCGYIPQGFQPEAYGLTERETVDYEEEEYILFTGKVHRRYNERARVLERLINKGYEVKWHGERVPWTWKNLGFKMRYPGLNRSHQCKPVYFSELAEAIGRSRVVLGLQMYSDIELCISSRLWQVLGCGGFFLCQYIKGIEKIFELDKELVCYNDEEDLLEKLDYYWRQSDKRREIAAAGQKKIWGLHKYSDRFREMAKIVL